MAMPLNPDPVRASFDLERLPITLLNNPYVVSPDGRRPTGAPRWIDEVDHPYLHGHFAPTTEEVIDVPVEVEDGEIPRDLSGMFIANGPNQRFKPVNRYHYYDGDAMLNAILFDEGKATFNGRWIRTRAFDAETARGEAIWPGLCGPYDPSLPFFPIKDTSNTDVVYFAGRLLTLWYMAGQPYSVDPRTLETIGEEDFGGMLRHTLSAHSKSDARTGEMLFFDYHDDAPYMTYGVVDAEGRLVHDVPIDLPGPRSPHDMGLTPRYCVLHDLPFFHDAEILRAHGRRVLAFHRDKATRFGVIPRYGASADVKWFEFEPCYVLHVVNCWEEGDWVVQIGCRQPHPGMPREEIDGRLASQMAERRRVHELHEWRMNMRTGETRERALDDLNTEFPTVNRSWIGRRNRYAYHQLLPTPVAGEMHGRCQTFDALVKYDLETGAYQRYDYGEGVCGSESHFAARKGAGGDAAEDDGYVIAYTHDARDWVSRCLIFDAADVARGPIATLRLPRRFGVTFHHAWIDGGALAG